MGGYFKVKYLSLTGLNELQRLTALTSYAVWGKENNLYPYQRCMSVYEGPMRLFPITSSLHRWSSAFLWLKVLCNSQNEFMSSRFYFYN